MSKSVTKNYLYNLMYEVLVLLVPLITTPYVSRVLGPTQIGNYGYTAGILSYFGIIAANGTINYAKREIAYHQNDEKIRSKLFYEILLFRVTFTAVVTAVYCIFISMVDSSLRVFYIIQIITIASWFVDVSWFFQGMEDFKVTAIRNSIVKLVGAALILLFVKKESDILIYILVNCGVAFVGNITMLAYLPRYLVKIPWKELHPFAHVRGIMGLFAPVIAIQVYTVLDQTMLGALINTTEVGYYTQAQKIIKLALTIISSFAAVLLPRIATLIERKRLDEVRHYYNTTIDYLFVLATPMVVGCVTVSNHFVPVFFGQGYDAVVPIMKISSILFIVIGFGQIAGSILIPLKKQKQYTIAVSAGAVVNFCLNLLLIPKFWAVGAAVASVIAECTVSFLELYNIRKDFEISYILRAFLSYLWPALLMGSVIIMIRQLFEASLAAVIVEVVGGALVYFGILIIRNDWCVQFVLEKIKNKR